MQKRLLALVATVAVVLSMFAGIAFAADGDVLTVTVPTATIAGKALSGTVALTFEGTTSDQTANLSATLALGAGTAEPIALTFTKGADDENYSFTHTATADFAPGVYKLVVTAGSKESEAKTINVAGVDTHKFRLGTTKVISSNATVGYQLIQGSIVKANNASDGRDFDVTVSGTEFGPIAVDAIGGYFSFYLPTNIPAQDVTLSAVPSDGDITVDVVDATIKVRYNVTTNPTELKFAFTGKQTPVAITGKVTDANGKVVKDATVKLIAVDDGNKNYAPDGLKTDPNGEFGFVVLLWNAASDLELEIGGKLHAEGEITGIAASLAVSPANTIPVVGATTFKVTGSGFKASTKIDFDVLDADDTPVHSFNVTANAEGNIPANTTFVWTPGAVGNYTLVAKQLNYEAKATITVTNPSTYNLIGAEDLKTLPVATKTFVFGPGTTGIHLVKYIPGTPPTTSTDFVYTVKVDGKATSLVKSTGPIDITSTKLATRTIQVIAYAKDGDGAYTVEVFNKTYEAEVTGWAVELDVDTLTVGQTQTITFVVKNKDGLAVNNATIKFAGYELNPANYNAQNGTYIFKDVKINKVDSYPITVQLGVVDKAKLTLEVVGQKVYNVTSDVDALLQGKAQAVKLTITKDGNAVTPARIKLIDEDGVTKELNFSFVSEGVIKIKEAITAAGTYTLRAENFDGTNCGEVKLEVVAPKLILIDEDTANLTDNFKTKVNFKVVDPRDDSVLDSDITLAANKYVGAIEVSDANGGSVLVVAKEATIMGAEGYTLTIFAQNADFTTAAKDGKAIKVEVKILGGVVDGHFEVKKAAITSDPEIIIIGANNNLTLTYADANGKAIEGKEIKAGGASLGKTDENGQVIYPVSVATGAVEVTGATDTDKLVKKTIKIGYDAEAPKVTYKADGDKATLVITDNVRLARIQIAGKEIDFWPGAKYEQEVTLKPGVNKFAVKAQDTNYNVLDEVVEIEYVAESVVLKDEQVKRQGEFVFVQLRQFEELGAQVGWKAETKTATFIVGETKVEVTIGSQTAKVNGEAVQMPAAPFIANDRTYVPTRFIAEQLGWDVHWAAGDIVTITLP